MREKYSGVHTSVMDHPQSLQIVVEGMSDYNGLRINKCIQRLAYRSKRKQSLCVFLCCDTGKPSVIIAVSSNGTTLF